MLTLFAICGLGSCTTPLTRYNNLANQYGFNRLSINSTPFDLIYFGKSVTNGWENKNILHIYIEGDGTPWIAGKWIAQDPTPRNPVMLKLMKLDPNPSILLGRPCYHVGNQNNNCDAGYWTMARYSPEVIMSMANAVAGLLKKYDFQKVALFGHSGGGVIATLVAKELTEAVAVITIGANLDIDVWASGHGFSLLDKSINPARIPLEQSDAIALHLYGDQDAVVPYSLMAGYFAARPDIRAEVYKGFNHTCCWADIWPQILHDLNDQIQNSPRNPAVTEE